jgi:hypothetical protein
MKHERDFQCLVKLAEEISKMPPEQLEMHEAEILEHLRAISREEKRKTLI